MAVTETKKYLQEFETQGLLDLETRAPGTYVVKMMLRGNSLLSSVFIKTIAAGATVKVNYFQTTTGTEDDPERHNLHGHPIITDTAAGKTFQVIVPHIHNKPICEVIVAGGAVEFGVYVTLVGYLPQTGVYLDGVTADLNEDGGNPIVVYDPSGGKFWLLRGDQGAMLVSVQEPAGEVLEATVPLSPGPLADVLVGTVPVGKKWHVKYAELVAPGYGTWEVTIAGVRKGGGAVSPAREHDRATMPGHVVALAGQEVKVRYNYTYGPAGVDASAFIGFREV